MKASYDGKVGIYFNIIYVISLNKYMNLCERKDTECEYTEFRQRL